MNIFLIEIKSSQQTVVYVAREHSPNTNPKFSSRRQLERVFSSRVHDQMQPTVNGLPTSYKVSRQVILDMICYNKRPF